MSTIVILFRCLFRCSDCILYACICIAVFALSNALDGEITPGVCKGSVSQASFQRVDVKNADVGHLELSDI